MTVGACCGKQSSIIEDKLGFPSKSSIQYQLGVFFDNADIQNISYDELGEMNVQIEFVALSLLAMDLGKLEAFNLA